MVLIKCKECGKEFSDTSNVCPNCGYKQTESMKKIKNKTKVLFYTSILCLLVCLLAILIGESLLYEKKANKLYMQATAMKVSVKYDEAIPIYKEIINKYPRSSIVNSAKTDLDLCEKRVLRRNIEHNTPIILKAVNEFPARKFPATQKGTMPLGKSISALEHITCDSSQKAAETYLQRAYLYEDYLAATLLVKSSCDYKIGKWNINSEDNIIYTVSKTRTGHALNGEEVKIHYSYIVNITNDTIAAQDHKSCFVMSTIASELFGKEAKKIAVDYTKECIFPIKLEGVLK